MANHKSAIKRHRQNVKRRERNLTVKSALRTAIKKVKDALTGGKIEDAKAGLSQAFSVIDRAVSKGVLHRKNASRKISRLSSALASTGAKQAPKS